MVVSAGPNTIGIPALNNSACFRFTATQTLPIVAVRVRWPNVTTPGAVTLRIETIDVTTGKPSGTLWDANAQLTGIVPATGVTGILYTFAAAPTTPLVIGTEYAVFFITTTAGTTMNLGSGSPNNDLTPFYPYNCLSAADGTTRTNLTEIVRAPPMVAFTLSDASINAMGCYTFTNLASINVFGNRAAGIQIAVPSGAVLSVIGIRGLHARVGVPAGDVRVRVLDSSNNLVAGATTVIDKDSMTGSSNRRWMALFAAPVSIPAGTYRIVEDSGASVDAANCWTVAQAQHMVTALRATDYVSISTLDLTATPIVWTENTLAVSAFQLILNGLSGAGGGGSAGPWGMVR